MHIFLTSQKMTWSSCYQRQINTNYNFHYQSFLSIKRTTNNALKRRIKIPNARANILVYSSTQIQWKFSGNSIPHCFCSVNLNYPINCSYYSNYADTHLNTTTGRHSNSSSYFEKLITSRFAKDLVAICKSRVATFTENPGR
jgi:hypothetical protein